CFSPSSKPTKSKKLKSNRPTGSSKTPKNRSSAKSTKKEVDILSPAAMENVYYISHNAVECLECRGFGWPNANKKKKKGTKQKKK
uniref:small lysine-rich protein 1 n=1 Tax=Monopterus albus TaxID=43700 RepID=UPI0009B45C0F